MDFSYLINILLKRKWLLLSVVLVSAASTWFLIGKLPPAFKSKAIISTGIIDYKGPNLQKDNPFIQKFQIESSFNGLIEKMKSRNTIKLLTDRLLQHDLSGSDSKEAPFREPDTEKSGLTQEELDNFAVRLRTSNLQTDSSLHEKPQPEQYSFRIAEAYGYDYETLLKKLDIKRIGETDFMSVEFESENRELAFFVVKTYLEEFLKLHDFDISETENTAINFHQKQSVERKAALDAKIREINEYKRVNNLVDIETQQKSVVGHLQELELRKEEQSQIIEAAKMQLPILNAKIAEFTKATGNDYLGNLNLGEDYNKLDSQIKGLQEDLVDEVAKGGPRVAAISNKIVTLREQQSRFIQKNIPVGVKGKDKYADLVLAWMGERLEYELNLKYAIEAKKSYESEILKSQGNVRQLVLDDNELNTLNADKDRLQAEYLKANEDFTDAKLFADGTKNPLVEVEPAELASEPEPAHRSMFSAFAGIASGSIASILFFLLAFMDSSLQSPSQFLRSTRLPLLGYVNKVKVKNMNLQHMFASTLPQADVEAFKENIRKLRTAIENSGAKKILFVSPKEQEGKSFLIVMLAYALSLNNKRILIIDTNFKNNTLSNFKTKSYIEITTDPSVGIMAKGLGTGQKQLAAPPGAEEYSDPQLKNIDIIGNKGGSQSPAEVLAGKDFQKVLEQYNKKYDYIFMEAASMNKFSDARELMPFADKVVGIFSSQSPIGNHDNDTIQYLRDMNDKMLGGVLNNVDLKNL